MAPAFTARIYSDRVVCGETTTPLAAPVWSRAVSSQLSNLHQLRCSDAPAQTIARAWRELGEHLYRLVFDEDLRKEFEGSAPATLALDIRDGQLERLPWECLHDGKEWVGLNRNIGRLLRTDCPVPAGPERACSRLEFSAMLFDPLLDPALPMTHGTAGANLPEACGVLAQLSGAPGSVHVTVRCHATLNDFVAELGRCPHVQYLYGCGGRGWLGLEDSHGRLDAISSKIFDAKIRRAVEGGLRLVLVEFPADYVGAPEQDVFLGPEMHGLRVRAGGLVRTMMSAGVPAAIVIQSPMSELDRIDFFDAVFGAISEGAAMPDAIGRARLHLAERNPNPMVWAGAAAFVQPALLERGEALIELTLSEEDPRIEVVGLPSELPVILRRDAALVGRHNERVRLAQMLDSSEAATWVLGPEGIGKTSLTAVVAQRVSRWFDEVVCVRFRDADCGHDGPLGDPKLGVLTGAARSMGMVPKPGESYRGLLMRLRRYLATGRRRLLVIDEPPAQHADILEELLNNLPACCKTVVTSREKLCSGGEVLELEPMPDEDIATLFRTLGAGGTVAGDGGPEDVPPLDGLIAAAGGHPLAAKLLAGIARYHGAELGELKAAVTLPNLVVSAVASAPAEAVRLWQIASAFEPGARRDVLEQFYEDRPALERAIDAAVRSGLVDTCCGGGLVVVHRLLRSGCTGMDRCAGWREGSVRAALHLLSMCQAAGSIVAAAHAAGRGAPPSARADLQAAVERLLQSEQHDIITALCWLEDAAQWRDLTYFTRQMYELFSHNGYWQAGVACSRMSLAAARRVGDPLGDARARFRHAIALGAVGMLDDAAKLGCLALEELIERHAGKAELLSVRRRLGEVARRQKDRMTTLWHFRAALELSHELLDASAEAAVCLDLAAIAREEGDLEAAQGLCLRRLDIEHSAGRTAAVGETLRLLATIAHERGDIDAAIRWSRQRVALHEELGDAAGLRDARRTLAALADISGDDELLQEALADTPAVVEPAPIPKRQPPLDAEGDGLSLVGETEALSGAAHLPKLIRTLATEGHRAEAIRICERCSHIFEKLGDLSIAALALRTQAELAHELGQTNEALGLLARSASLCSECGDDHGAADSHCRAAELSFATDQDALCRAHLCNALRVGLAAGEAPLGMALGAIGSVGRGAAGQARHEQFTRMLDHYREAVATFKGDTAGPWARDISNRVLDGVSLAVEAGSHAMPAKSDMLSNAQRHIWTIEQSIGQLGLSAWLGSIAQRDGGGVQPDDRTVTSNQ